ncbi:hypothetical protein [Pedobacter montanisoli]|uniref:Lipoprotein n=1 Tax=Pedobacter montanisoli TaxID=2923277 RepID=A0ABT0A038_9SPHI|nr:hypothetical protein [Pedobacter montanisoli]MCJ0743912.1 hypothetical protein [Pedobacter montanisoli]
MKTNKIIYLTFLIMACNSSNPESNKEELTTQTITSRVSVDVDTPPPILQSNFKNIHDWLNDICSHDQPKVEISKFEIGLIEGEDLKGNKEYMLHLIGTNTYNKANHSEIRNDFIPKNAYFKLPKEFAQNLSHNQILDKIIAELKDFTKSNTFEQSFLTNAKEIKFSRTNQIIWSK